MAVNAPTASPRKFISHQLGLSLTAAATLTVPASASTVTIQADGQDVRYTLDGLTTPTSTVGILLKNGTSIVLAAGDAAAAKFIQVAATALLNAAYSSSHS